MGKTEAMTVASKYNSEHANNFTVTCNKEIIKGVKSVKHFGMQLDEIFSWEYTTQAVEFILSAVKHFPTVQTSSLCLSF